MGSITRSIFITYWGEQVKVGGTKQLGVLCGSSQHARTLLPAVLCPLWVQRVLAKVLVRERGQFRCARLCSCISEVQWHAWCSSFSPAAVFFHIVIASKSQAGTFIHYQP